MIVHQSLLNLSCLRTFEFRTPLGTSLLLITATLFTMALIFLSGLLLNSYIIILHPTENERVLLIITLHVRIYKATVGLRTTEEKRRNVFKTFSLDVRKVAWCQPEF